MGLHHCGAKGGSTYLKPIKLIGLGERNISKLISCKFPMHKTPNKNHLRLIRTCPCLEAMQLALSLYQNTTGAGTLGLHIVHSVNSEGGQKEPVILNSPTAWSLQHSPRVATLQGSHWHVVAQNTTNIGKFLYSCFQEPTKQNQNS